MAERRLSREEVGVVMTLKELGQTNVAIARTLGVSEGAIHYRLKREACGRDDGRSHRSSAVARYAEIIDWWVAENGTNRHRPTLKLLYERLVEHHGYELSYDALRRYVRRHYPEWLKKGARLRLETPPGKLAQVDWKEDLRVQIGGVGQWRTVHVLVVELSFSRKTVLWASEHKTLAALVSGQQMAWRTLGGMPEWVRPDCMKAAVKRWRGQHSILNDGYRRYMEGVGIGVFPARPGHGSDKGKVEKRIRDVLDRIEIERRVFVSLAQFQAHLERGVRALESEWRCGATGRTVAESFAYERKYLKPLPAILPELPVAEGRRRVRRDGTVCFEGNYYQVPDECRERMVLCVQTGQQIRIYLEGREVVRHDHLPGTRGMVRLWPAAITGSRRPLSGRVRNWALEVASRQVSIYEEMMTGGRS